MAKYEHCMLMVSNAKEIRKGGGLFSRGEAAGWGYDCWIDYYQANGTVRSESISDINQPLDHNPFKRAFARLTAEGWELVSVQHGNLVIAIWGGSKYKEDTEIHWDTLSNISKVAYFKRQLTN